MKSIKIMGLLDLFKKKEEEKPVQQTAEPPKQLSLKKYPVCIICHEEHSVMYRIPNTNNYVCRACKHLVRLK